MADHKAETVRELRRQGDDETADAIENGTFDASKGDDRPIER